MWAFCDESRKNQLEFCYNRNFSPVCYPTALVAKFGLLSDLFWRILQYLDLCIVFWRRKSQFKTLRRIQNSIQPTPTAPCVANFSRFFLLDRVYIWILDTPFCVWSATWTRKPDHLMLIPKVKKSKSRDPVKIHSNSVVTAMSQLWAMQTRWYWYLDRFLICCAGFWSTTSFVLCFSAEKLIWSPCAELEMRSNLLHREFTAPIFREFPH